MERSSNAFKNASKSIRNIINEAFRAISNILKKELFPKIIQNFSLPSKKSPTPRSSLIFTVSSLYSNSDWESVAGIFHLYYICEYIQIENLISENGQLIHLFVRRAKATRANIWRRVFFSMWECSFEDTIEFWLKVYIWKGRRELHETLTFLFVDCKKEIKLETFE